jgi:hypothetical protein
MSEPIYPPPTQPETWARVQFYWDWSGFLIGFTIDSTVIALMLGWLTIEVWR